MAMNREYDSLVDEATTAFDSRHLALKWLQSPCELLDNRIPAEVAKSEDGYALVLAIIYRIRGTIAHFPLGPGRQTEDH